MLEIINTALLSQGMETVSTNDGTDEYRVLAANWPMIVEAELEDGNYSFTRAEATLGAAVSGSYGYAKAYAIPASALHVRNLWFEATDGTRTQVPWTQDSTYVHLDNDDDETVKIEYLVSATSDLWKANFKKGVQAKLEAVILRAVKEEYGEAETMEAQAEVYFQRARTSSSRSRSATSPFRSGPIAEARFRRGTT